MGLYELRLKNIISPKCVELRLSSNHRYTNDFLSPVSILHVLTERCLVLDGALHPIISERHLCVEMPDWKARAAGLTEEDRFPDVSADAHLKAAADRGGVTITSRAINTPLSDYLALLDPKCVAN